jgi:perosamine synthetase
VDYAGQPCDYDALREITDQHGLALVDDACHALGARYKGRPAGSLADLNTFSFHPVKHITTGEGGMVTTDDAGLAQKMRLFRNHGITSDHHQRDKQGSWFYEMVDLGYNYRITDFQCALGMSQLGKLSNFVALRRNIARRYDGAFAQSPLVQPLRVREDAAHSYHLYVVLLKTGGAGATRAQVFAALRAQGIGVNVHYVPVHLHPYYRDRFGTRPGLCPVAEAAYQRMLSLPMFPRMARQDVDDVVAALAGAADRLMKAAN